METAAPIHLLPFTKMHGLGNDFVMVKADDVAALLRSCVEHAAFTAALSTLARTVCDRRFGIGADGLIVAVPLVKNSGKIAGNQTGVVSSIYSVLEQIVQAYPSYDQCDLAWIYVNSDGSSSDMCGNGLRCLTYFARENAAGAANSKSNVWPQSDHFKVATRAYPVDVSLSWPAAAPALSSGSGGACVGAEQSLCRAVRTSLAGPDFKHKLIDLALGDITLSATVVDMGNPHCVIFDCPALQLEQYQGCMQDISSGASAAFLEKFPVPLIDLAHQIQALPVFPQGVNVEFVLPQSAERAIVYVVERGCGPTLACASGGAAVVASGVIQERLNRQCCVILPGGELEVTWSSLDNRIELNGPAQISFSGEFPVAGFVSSQIASSESSNCSDREELPA